MKTTSLYAAPALFSTLGACHAYFPISGAVAAAESHNNALFTAANQIPNVTDSVSLLDDINNTELNLTWRTYYYTSFPWYHRTHN